MRPAALSLALAAGCTLASHMVHATPSGHDMHGDTTLYWGAGGEVDITELDWTSGETGTLISWDSFAWVGDDDLKFRIEAEGEAEDGETTDSELKTLLSWNVDEFWDLQAGARFDLAEGGRTWAAIGLHGMMPYFMETDAFVFLDRDGNLAVSADVEVDFALTQDLFLQPHVGVEAYAQDMPDAGVGLAKLELGLQLRYEITRKFAPYIEIVHERALGETSIIQQENGEDPGHTTIRAGLRFRL